MLRRSFLGALALTFAARAVQAQASAADGQFALPSAIMGKDREINVRLPAGYGDDPQRRYPVIYLLDGGLAQDFPHYAELAYQAAVNGLMQPVIVVGVASEDRQNELTWRSTDRRIVRQWPNHGQSDRFRRFLGEEVKPWVEARYRTNGDDAVLGESAAALFIVETFLKQPDLFDRYLAVSPAMWWDRVSLGRDARRLIGAHPAAPRQLLLTIGDEGGQMQDGVNALVTALQAAAPQGLDWSYAPRHDLTHSTIFAAVAEGFLSRAYPVTETSRP